eukprot:COSAG06_NODE_6665_length_2835_cov_2.151681_2_plen_98_part_00
MAPTRCRVSHSHGCGATAAAHVLYACELGEFDASGAMMEGGGNVRCSISWRRGPRSLGSPRPCTLPGLHAARATLASPFQWPEDAMSNKSECSHYDQ